MKGYLPIDREQRTEMLAEVGIEIEDLFATIPRRSACQRLIYPSGSAWPLGDGNQTRNQCPGR